MAISDYEKTIYNMRSVPVKRTKEVEERLMTALQIASSHLRVIIGQEDEPLKIRAYQGKRMKVVQMMNELGISLKRDISAAISEVVNDVAYTEQDATNDLLLEHDDADLMVDFTEIPRQTIDALAQRYDVDGLRISSNIWAQTQIGEIENAVLSGIARGQSAKEMSDNLTQFILGGSKGMGTSVQAKAMRLARTEINNAYWESARRSSAQSPIVEGVRWHLSGRHPENDVCDLLATYDLFDLGKGVYPPEYLPAKAHPNCLCYQVDVLRKINQWDKPKTDYTQKEIEFNVPITTAKGKRSAKKVRMPVLEFALKRSEMAISDGGMTGTSTLGFVPYDLREIRSNFSGVSEGFMKKQYQLFTEAVSNVVKSAIPERVVPTEVVPPIVVKETPALPPYTPVAKAYDLMLQGGMENSEKLKAGYRRSGSAREWVQEMTDTDIGEAFKLGQRLRSEEVPISVNFPTEALPKMIKSGRSKNLFETTASLEELEELGMEGEWETETRHGWEEDLIKSGSPQRQADKEKAAHLYEEMPAKQKPTYGALNFGNDRNGAATGYGAAWLELENHVKNRSTFSPDNSSWTSDVATFKYAETFFQYQDGRERMVNIENKTNPKSGYVEVQVWNGIDFKEDVKALHIPAEKLKEFQRLQPDLEKELREFSSKFDVEIVVHEVEDK